MPRGKFTNHKGRNRKFTSPEELEEQRKQDEHKKWRKNKDGSDSDESDASGDKSGSGSDDDSDSDSDDQGKAKGVSGLIEIENPNRVQKKSKKLTKIDVAEVEAPQLSRREREEIEKQRAAAAYQKAHAEGRTDQARADLARLAIIKQQREEAAKKREAEKKAKEEATKKR